MNSVTNEIKELASGSKMLALCILSTVLAALKLAIGGTNVNGVSIVNIDIFLIVAAIGLWIIYFNAKNGGELETKGYTIVKVCYNIKLVILIIATVIIIAAGAVCAALAGKMIDELQNREDEIVEYMMDNASFESSGVSEDEFKDNFHEMLTNEDAESVIVIVALTCVVAFLFVMIFILIYYAKMIKMMKSIRSNVNGTNNVNTYHSGYLSFIFIVTAILNGLSALSNFAIGEIPTALLSGVSCGMFVVIYLLLREYKEEMYRISYLQPEAYMPQGYGTPTNTGIPTDTTNNPLDYKAPEDDDNQQ